MSFTPLNTVICAPPTQLPMAPPMLIPQLSNPGVLLFPQPLPPVISLTPSPRNSRSPSLINVFPSIPSLSQFLGDYYTISDSKQPGKYLNADATNSHWRTVVNQNNSFRVIFSEFNGENQTVQIRVAPDGRIQLFSTIHQDISFFLVNTPERVPELLRWQNEYDHEHFVDWRRINNRLKTGGTFDGTPNSISVSPARSASFHFDELPNVPFEDPELPAINPTLSDMESRSRMRSLPQRKRLSFNPSDSLLQSQSRDTSPAPVSNPPSPCLSSHSMNDLQLHFDRDSKQNLVTRVEPEVNDLIGEFYAEEKDYRHNQKGRWGPPVLRGEDVLFIPAKKQAALENVTELIKVVKATSTIRHASMVCQKKKKRQKKGFLVYLQLNSAEEVQAFLKGPYRRFQSTVQGVKTAVFTPCAKDKHSESA